jgi:hypothetical protein
MANSWRPPLIVGTHKHSLGGSPWLREAFSLESVMVSADSVILNYSFWQRVVPYMAIRDVRLEQARAFREPIDSIRIILANRRSLRLQRIREGTAALFDVLHRAWENNHAPGVIIPSLSDRPRPFPSWIVWWASGAALIAMLVAPRDIWRELKWPKSAPDAKSLASFPTVPSGWAGPPMPIYAHAAMGHRWGVYYATGTFTHSQTDHFSSCLAAITFRLRRNHFGFGAFALRDLRDRHARWHRCFVIARGRCPIPDGRWIDHDGARELLDGTSQSRYQSVAGGVAESGGDRGTFDAIRATQRGGVYLSPEGDPWPCRQIAGSAAQRRPQRGDFCRANYSRTARPVSYPAAE